MAKIVFIPTSIKGSRNPNTEMTKSKTKTFKPKIEATSVNRRITISPYFSIAELKK